ncbi:MAG: hypothetical protein LBU75_03310 [Desulfovibrio sp.]|jgi:hypothetical protein|nr:hypothetical protein [Desulfovibrio sp.]
MTACAPDWGGGSRFYLPNEDTAVLRMALRALPSRVRRPVFVGGSGMALLEGISVLPELEEAAYVDLASFQLDYFQSLRDAVERSRSPKELLEWFSALVFPELHAYSARRGIALTLTQVQEALGQRFGLDCFFKKTSLDAVQRLLPRISCTCSDIVSYLSGRDGRHGKDGRNGRHDFIYLSNVPDYLPPGAVGELATACAAHAAPVYMLVTTACADQALVSSRFSDAGFQEHPVSGALNERNRGLGSPALQAAWNRHGRIHVYMPCMQPQ